MVDVVIGEEVDVERARAPAALVGAVAAEGAFDLLRARAAASAVSGVVSIAAQQLMNGG